MRRITRYMAGQIATVTFFATVVLCVAVMLVQSVRLVDLIVNRGLPISEFAYMATLMVPRFVALVMPIALFGATLFTYNRMINDHELVVLRSAGLSSAALSRPAFVVGLGAMAICFSLTLYFMPTAAQELRFHLNKTRSQWGAALLHEGKFTNVGQNTTIFVRERTPGGELRGLLYYNAEDPEDTYTVIAERGAIVDTEKGPRIVVLDGTRQSFEDGRMHLVRFDRSTIDVGVSADQPDNRWVQPEERYLPDLLDPSETNPNDVYYRDKLIAEGHSRLVLPLLPLTYAGVAVAFLLRAGFSRRGNLPALGMAVGVMTAILVAHLSILNLAGRIPQLLPLLYVNALGPLLAAVAALLTPPRRRRREPPADAGADGADGAPAGAPAE